MEKFEKELSALEKAYNAKIDARDINIFNILFNGHEEVELHSRFISYLLSIPNRDFLELFVHNILKETDFPVDGSEVYPNKEQKKEFYEIDIFIINKNKSRAIIIENKLDATESNHFNDDTNKKPEKIKECSYKGQLERYYYTIKNGYYKKGGEYLKFPKEYEQFICNQVSVYYLTLYQEPSATTIGKLEEEEIFNRGKHIIWYGKDIQKWLKECLNKTKDESLQQLISQYLDLVKQITSDVDKAIELKKFIGDNYKHAFALFKESTFKDKYKCINEEFKHVKWHTVHEFFTELALELGGAEFSEDFNENLTKITWDNSKQAELIIKFKYNGVELRIVNDNKNGFTLQNLNKRVWGKFSNKVEVVKIEDVKFCDFSNEATFNIINTDYRKKIISAILEEIGEKYDRIDTPIA